MADPAATRREQAGHPQRATQVAVEEATINNCCKTQDGYRRPFSFIALPS